MNDRAVELLEQYDIEIVRTRKGRGAIICDTADRCLILKEYKGNEKRLELQSKLLQRIADAGKVRAERILPTKEGALCAKGGDGTVCILKTWQDGRECSINDTAECVQAVKLLGRLHEAMELPAEEAEGFAVFPREQEYERHNREIRKVKKYLKEKRQRHPFEVRLLGVCDYFLEQALEVTEQWQAYADVFRRRDEKDRQHQTTAFCHGDYQYHNVLMGSGGWFVVNFEKCLPDHAVGDLYLILRKLLEKGNWAAEMGRELLRAYEMERSLSAEDRIDLYYRLAYPEKFWKIANFYYNSGKAWIPGKNQEKLEKLIAQETAKQRFLDEVFRDVAG